MSERVNPFADLGDFAPAPSKPKAEQRAVIDQVAADNGFPSRQPVKSAKTSPPTTEPSPPELRKHRRYTTGRNKQINIKATDETIQRLYRLADEKHVPLGELLELALNALENAP